jgi:hypothetical protein
MLARAAVSNVTQSTLQAGIKQLEERLGVLVAFLASPRRVSPSSPGRFGCSPITASGSRN